jgi:hypothetical protein
MTAAASAPDATTLEAITYGTSEVLTNFAPLEGRAQKLEKAAAVVLVYERLLKIVKIRQKKLELALEEHRHERRKELERALQFLNLLAPKMQAIKVFLETQTPAEAEAQAAKIAATATEVLNNFTTFEARIEAHAQARAQAEAQARADAEAHAYKQKLAEAEATVQEYRELDIQLGILQKEKLSMLLRVQKAWLILQEEKMRHAPRAQTPTLPDLEASEIIVLSELEESEKMALLVLTQRLGFDSGSSSGSGSGSG